MINNIVEYKGYIAKLYFDLEDKIIVGKVTNANANIAFHAENAGEVHQEFEAMIDTYIEACEAEGIKVSTPNSGRLNLRIDPTIHGKIAAQAAQNNLSLNAFATQILKNSVEESQTAHFSHH